jgi:DNA helicase-2/ATP-dependent DNA helicase PcrA
VLVGDPRQATYKTNNGAKHAKYSGYKIINRLIDWSKRADTEIEGLMYSYRCRQEICDFSDHFFVEFDNTESRNNNQTDHDGIFLVRTEDVPQYIKKYNPQILRYSKKDKCMGYSASNFKASKGLTFNRTLLFPHGPLKKLLGNGNFSALKEPSALYVAVTRAEQSMAIVYDGETVIDGFTVYEPEAKKV